MDVIFHIGAGKTGSSSIQQALRINQTLVEKAGFELPPADLRLGGKVQGYHVFGFERLKQGDGDDPRAEFAEFFKKTAATAQTKGRRGIIFSAENLSNPFDWADFFGSSFDGHNVRVILYVRRQDDYLLSAWQQWGLKEGLGFQDWLIGRVGNEGNWRTTIEQWEAVASDSVEVGLYERSELQDGDVVGDFFARVGIEGDRETAPRANSSHSLEVEALATSSPHLFSSPNDNDFMNFVANSGLGLEQKRSSDSRISYATRMAILSRYAHSNRWIQDTYFPDLSRHYLFKMPRPEDHQLVTQESLDRTQVGLLTELVYSLHKRISEVEKRR